MHNKNQTLRMISLFINRETQQLSLDKSTVTSLGFPRFSIDPQYFKVLNSRMNHYGFQYQIGLNEDILPFTPDLNCKPGGLHFISKEEIHRYLKYGNLIAEVQIPPDAQWTFDEKTQKGKASKLIVQRVVNFDKYFADSQWILNEFIPKHYPYLIQFTEDEKLIRQFLSKNIASFAYLNSPSQELTELFVRCYSEQAFELDMPLDLKLIAVCAQPNLIRQICNFEELIAIPQLIELDKLPEEALLNILIRIPHMIIELRNPSIELQVLFIKVHPNMITTFNACSEAKVQATIENAKYLDLLNTEEIKLFIAKKPTSVIELEFNDKILSRNERLEIAMMAKPELILHFPEAPINIKKLALEYNSKKPEIKEQLALITSLLEILTNQEEKRELLVCSIILNNKLIYDLKLDAEACELLIRQAPWLIKHIPDEFCTLELGKLLIDIDWRYVDRIPKQSFSDELARYAILKNPYAIGLFKPKYEMELLAVSLDGMVLQVINSLPNYELAKVAYQQNREALKFIHVMFHEQLKKECN